MFARKRPSKAVFTVVHGFDREPFGTQVFVQHAAHFLVVVYDQDAIHIHLYANSQDRTNGSSEFKNDKHLPCLCKLLTWAECCAVLT